MRHQVFGLSAISLLIVASTAGAQRRSPPPIIQVPPPASVEQYGAWIVDRLGSGYAAHTSNESNSVFGVFCTTDYVVYVDTGNTCEEKASYPTLVNSPAGAFSANFECTIINKTTYILVAPLSRVFVNSFEIGGEIGVAIPLASGRFQVTRFSLTGALKAGDRAVQLAKVSQKSGSDKSLEDYKL